MSTMDSPTASELYEFAMKDVDDAVEHLPALIAYLQTGTEDEKETAVGVIIEISEYRPQTLQPYISQIIGHFLSSSSQRERLSLVVGNVATVVPKQTVEYYHDELFSVFTETTSEYIKAHLLPWFSVTLSQKPEIVASIAEEAALLLENNRTSLRQRSLKTLSEVASTYPDAIEPYVELFDMLLDHSGTIERAEAIVILAKHARHRKGILETTDVVDTISHEMRSRHEMLRARATEGAGILLRGYPGYWNKFNSQLLPNLADPSDWVRREAGRACLNLAAADASLVDNPTELSARLYELNDEFNYTESFGEDAQTALAALESGGP